jgi:hypothetical protein
MVVMVKATQMDQCFEVVNKRRKSNRFSLGVLISKRLKGGSGT